MTGKREKNTDGENNLPQAKKQLGQNFLTSKPAIAKVVAVAELSKSDTVLEIGPGRGALTKSILETDVGNVIAVEKDPRLVAHLQEQFAQEIAEKRLSLVTGDILTLDLAKFGLKNGKFKVVANIPYYITGRFLRYLLAEGPGPSLAVLVLQKEVAQRIVARKKESILSLSVKVFGEPTYIQTIKAGSFAPAPAVDSAILKIGNISHTKLDKKEEELFFLLLKAGFSQKRKQIGGNLLSVAPDNVLLPALHAAGIDRKVRAEDVPLGQWIALAKALAANTDPQPLYPQTQ